ncbi:hypothetical protein PILCRDRAFT_827917, partial [Piloderma croceum F 1598]
SGESGNSSIVKRMKIIHQNGFSWEELLTYWMTVYRNLVDSAQAIVLAMRKIRIDCETPINRSPSSAIPGPATVVNGVDVSGIGNGGGTAEGFVFDPEIASLIHQLWQDPVIPKVMDHSSEFYLMDSASYFFNEALRIGEQDYVPTETDVLRARQKSTGITATRFNMGQLLIHMFDVGGQCSERKKWIHYFKSVTSIIFCTVLSEYDQVLLEESKTNRMAEFLVLFKSVINSRWFLRTSTILFITKIDVFKSKLLKVPLEKYFPEYTAGSDINKAAKYILWRFMQANRARLSVYSHLTQATDTINIRLVFAAVKETILQNTLKDSRILRYAFRLCFSAGLLILSAHLSSRT